MSPMLIEIPDLTPELCEARAEYLRKLDWTPEAQRARSADFDTFAAAAYLFDAALLKQYPARPVLKVGDLATTPDGCEMRVDYIGQERAFCTYPDGGECSWRLSDLTYSRPCPEGWPEDGWYEVDEPEPDEGTTATVIDRIEQHASWDPAVGWVSADPLPGTRVGDRMTEHTPVGATVEHPLHGRIKVPCLGQFADNWTVVALPEESER